MSKCYVHCEDFGRMELKALSYIYFIYYLCDSGECGIFLFSWIVLLLWRE